MIGNHRAKILRIIGLLLIAVGAFIILQFIYSDIYTGLNQRKLHDRWAREASRATSVADSTHSASWARETASATTTAEETTPADNKPMPTTKQRIKIPEKKPFARIVIPKIGLDAIVVEGASKEALKLGPGHMEETAYPGEVGNLVISGHRVTYSRPFYHLDELEKGAPIYIHTTSQKFTYYVVEKKVVKPADASVIQPTQDRTLTLTTCNPLFSARTRLIIVAKMRDGG
ncbi:MAG: class E sortase [Actinobacteria bacterium]|nr:class E sortase [Actinomycetota bacterium]